MSRARDLSKLGNPGVFSVSTDNNVGVNSTAPVEKLNVVGVVSATSFYGDGSGLENLKSAGLGTAIIRDSEYGGEQIYYTNKELNITGDLTVDAPDSAEVAYTQYQEIVVDSGADFIIGDGDDFIPDILGIGTEVQQPGLLAGGGGRVRADNFSDKAGDGAPTFSSGVVITGVATATSFSGNADTATNAQGLTGTPDIDVRNITGVGLTLTGNVSIGGTLTYEDVTNVDSIGIITARTGVNITAGGVNVASGISTFKGVNFNGGELLKEKFNIISGKLSDNQTINVDNGMVHFFTTAETGISTANIISTTGINTDMSIGDTMAVTIITTAASAGYSTCVNIDGNYNDVQWLGGSDPTTGNASGKDVYTLQVFKTASATYTVLGAVNNFA